MRLEFTETFTKALKRLPNDRANRIRTTLKRFIETPDLPGLRLHKLEGTEAISLSSGRKDRIIIEKREQDGEEIWLVMDVGAHDHIYRKLNRR